MTTDRRRLFLILFTNLALVGACGEVTEPPGVDSGIDPPTPDAAVASPDADGATAQPDASDDPLAQHNDWFDGASVDGAWSRYQPELVDMDVSAGALTMAPNQYAHWFNRERGPLLYKQIAGNFSVTSRVRARRATSPGTPPTGAFHLGGLMARAPDDPDAPPDYVFIVVGRDGNDLSVETKTTVQGESDYIGPAWGSGDAELRICRIGDTFYMLERPVDGGEWDVAQTYDRPDLPGALEIGAIVYAPIDDPDLVVSFDEITFTSVWEKADCIQ